MKTDERLRARELRAQGWSIKEIERHLGVSRSSASLWTRDVVIGPNERARLVERVRLGPIVAAEKKAKRARETRRAAQEAGRRLLHERDASYAVGCALYWAEGTKGRNSVDIVNSDPELLATFVSFLRRHFDVPNERIGIVCNLFADHAERRRQIEDFWLGRLALDRSSLKRTAVNRYSKYSQKKRANKLPYGTCSIRVHSTQIAQTIYGSIQELGGFDRVEWLD